MIHSVGFVGVSWRGVRLVLRLGRERLKIYGSGLVRVVGRTAQRRPSLTNGPHDATFPLPRPENSTTAVFDEAAMRSDDRANDPQDNGGGAIRAVEPCVR